MILRTILAGALLLIFFLSSVKFYQNVIKYKTIKPDSELSMKKLKEVSEIKIKDIHWDSVILDKNIFNPHRSFQYREEEKTSNLITEETPQMPEIRLKGIVLNQYNEYIAYIKKNNEKTIAVRKGETIDGIKVVNITERNVVLQWKEQSFTLLLRAPRKIE